MRLKSIVAAPLSVLPQEHHWCKERFVKINRFIEVCLILPLSKPLRSDIQYQFLFKAICLLYTTIFRVKADACHGNPSQIEIVIDVCVIHFGMYF